MDDDTSNSGRKLRFLAADILTDVDLTSLLSCHLPPSFLARPKYPRKSSLFFMSADQDLSLATLARMMAKTSTGVQTEQKKQVVCALNGFDHEKYLEASLFGESKDEVYKPQYIHSASALYLHLRNPALIKGSSAPITYIRKEEIVQESLKLALDVLLTDPYALSFTQRLDAQIRNPPAEGVVPILDQHNKTLLLG